ncbi:hypothetical protein BGW38_004191 [Lunasporangiospora selenospora]|uniref:DUF3020 domain-containing protein n=1 Tax=Lunasporangiospora selenospora TaxID=979761 RepID=A0A9P6G0V7_9FUNG|nr:hypothetical protein BGW38_004191 [Lunasporangiospora selenospora]
MIRDDSAFQAQAALDSIAASPEDTTAGQDNLKRGMNTEKIRMENRERKKRWRELNEDRNKDNDLRCRVNKRAHKLFGKDESEHKSRWAEEEFGKRQMKRKEKERRRNPDAPNMDPLPTTPQSNTSLHDQLALHQQYVVQRQQDQVSPEQAVLNATSAAASALSHTQFDSATVKTALALNDLVRKTGNHLDLAQLTGVLTDPNLARQLIEIEANSKSTQPTAAAPPLMTINPPPVKEDAPTSTSQLMEADYPMDAVLTLMQLNGSWKA